MLLVAHSVFFGYVCVQSGRYSDRWTIRLSNPGRSNGFFCSLNNVQTDSGANPAWCSKSTGFLYLGIKRLGREIDHSLPCVPLVPLRALMVWAGTTLPFVCAIHFSYTRFAVGVQAGGSFVFVGNNISRESSCTIGVPLSIFGSTRSEM
jgi:hypothetical protein